MEEMAGTVSAAAAPWKPLLVAAMEANAQLKHSTFFQLSTVSRNGRPANRTVVFRGFQDNNDGIQINTDGRSSKMEDIKYCPFGEICWYFTDTWEQFRINGHIELVDGSNTNPIKIEQRERAWFATSVRSRYQYLGPAPCLPIISEEHGKNYQLDSSTRPADAFCLLVLNPEQVDYLNLKSNQRLKFTSRPSSDGCKAWMFEKVNP